MPDARLHEVMFARANAARWGVDPATFARALDASVAKAFPDAAPDRGDLERYVGALHLEDLALACACADGSEEAWQHFVLTYRPHLYRAADAIDPSGAARELADSIYADLFGLGARTGERQSLFRYFHGRSSLATWLRAVLAQRHVDRVRERHRSVPLPDGDVVDPAPPSATPDPHRSRFVALMQAALAAALGRLAPRDRLRLACYYAQQMTLAQVGRLLGEHEATVSRHLSRTRSALRADVEHWLTVDRQLSPDEVAACFESITEDAGPLDLRQLLPVDAGVTDVTEPGGAGKKRGLVRSSEGRTP